MKKVDVKNIYKPLDTFMMRTPILPFSYYEKLSSGNGNGYEVDKLLDAIKDSVVKEAITVTSLDLASSLNKLKKDISEKEKEKALNSLIKYLIRMSTRTTPFGLFSGVTTGHFGDKTDINVKDNSTFIKRTRPDTQWLFKVIGFLEKKDYILKDLIITWNSIVEFDGSRISIPYLSIYGEENNKDIDCSDTVSLRYSNAVKYVYEKSVYGIKYEELLNSLMEVYPNVERDKIINLLSELLKKEFLITNMRPPLDNANPFLYILKLLKDIDAANIEFEALNNIYILIDEYNHLPIGSGEDKYLHIIQKMKEIQKSKNYLQIDLKLNCNKVKLNKKVADDLSKAATMLLLLSSEVTCNSNITQYTNDFISKYGEEREIPLLELLNSDKGLGFPAEYKVPFVSKPLYTPNLDSNFEKIKEYLFKKVIKAIYAKKTNVVIEDKEIERFKPEEIDYEEMPNSLELNAFIKAKSQEDIDNENYELFIGPNIGSDSAGKTFGRFSDLLGEEVEDIYKEINRCESELLDKDTIFAQLIFAPNGRSIGNITLTPNIRDYEITLSTTVADKEKSISIQDLVVGIQKNRLYLKSISLGKRVVVKTNHMLNIEGMPNICRFLMDISDNDKRRWYPVDLFQVLSCFQYVPEIKIGKVTIMPQTWRLNEKILGVDLKKDSKETLYKAIQRWKDEWNVPDIIYQSEADNRLLLKLNNKAHIDELLHALKSKENIKLTEPECNEENLWVCGPSNTRFSSEFVVPFVKDKNPVKENKVFEYVKPTKLIQTFSTLSDERTVFPFGEWLFLKLYGNYSRENEFIAFEINEICNDFIQKEYINSFFFMRYGDPESHIRLRFKGDPEKIRSVVLPKLNQWFQLLKKEGLLSRVEIDTYVREIERYGGEGAIDYVENLFFYDSLFVINVLYLDRLNQFKMSIDDIAICSIIDILDNFGLEFCDQLKLLDMIIKPSENRKEFQKKRSHYISIGNSDDDWKRIRETEDGNMLYKLMKNRSESIQEYAKKLIQLIKENKLMNSMDNIILSVIHLHCNRLFGTDREKEREIISFVRHTLYALKYFKNKKEK